MNMKKIIRWFKSQVGITFTISAIISALLSILLTITFNTSTGMLVGFVVFTIYAFAIMSHFAMKIDEQLNATKLTSLWLTGDVKPFQKAIEIIENAQESIYATSQYGPQNIRLDLPSERSKLLVAIENKINERLKDFPEQPFVYERIIQYESSLSKENESDPFILFPDLIKENPPQTFAHCKQLWDIISTEKNSRVEINFYLTEPLASIPGILIIDKKYVLLSFTDLDQRPGDNGQISYRMLGALILEDRTAQHDQTGDFLKLFDRFKNKNNSKLVKGVSERQGKG